MFTFNNEDTKPFTKDYNNGIYEYTRLHHGLDHLIKHYMGLIKIPKVPLFHPYQPTGDTLENVRSHNGILGTIVTIRCPKETFNFLPEPVLTALKQNNVTSEQTDIFFVTQNMPWKNQQLLFRAQYWVHGHPQNDIAIENASFNLDTPCRVGIFSPTNPNIYCDGTQNTLSVNPISVSSHPGADETNVYPMIVCSPAFGGVMSGIDFDQTDAMYSIALTQDGRVAVTLHWLLNEEDQEQLTHISHSASSLSEFIKSVSTLKNSRLNTENGPLSQLLNLYNLVELQETYQQLFFAIEVQDFDTFRGLLDIFPYININAKNSKGQTLLHLASISSPKFIELLLNRGADQNIKDKNGKTPLQYAVNENRYDIVLQYIRLFYPSPQEIHQKLFELIAANDFDTFKVLLEVTNINVNAINNFSQTLLHIACAPGVSIQFLELLLKKGANPNLVEVNNWTPVQYAAYQGRSDAIQKFIELGASNINVDNYQWGDAIAMFKKGFGVNPNGNYQETERLLKERFASQTVPLIASMTEPRKLQQLLFDAITTNDFDTFSLLLASKSIDINAFGAGNMSLLHAASMRDISKEFSELLLNNGANPNVIEANGFSPLDYAIADGRADIVENYIKLRDSNNMLVTQVSNECWINAERMFAHKGQNTSGKADYEKTFQLINDVIAKVKKRPTI